MLFCSRAYLFFFLSVFAVYWAMPWRRARVWLLVVASFTFYAVCNKQLAVLITLSIVADYLLARGIDASSNTRVRKALLLVSLLGNMGMLCYFKYANFFLQSTAESLGALGISVSMPVLRVVLPVGISFYTFEAINYMVDVHRRRIPAERSLPNFMLFILFFPHLIAGPIVRARDFLPQIDRPKRWDWMRIQLGVEFFLMGLVKKLVIADRMALYVDPVYRNPGNYETHTVWMAVLAYALQVYCDFSGYTDMAIGSAHLLGYKLAKNFNMPYLARNISEFWRRWHISLSYWLRDYVFIPLGGSRGGTWQTCRNLVVTMTLAGLWHGPSWNYVLFGVIQGLLLCGHRFFRSFLRRWPQIEAALASGFGAALCVAFTFVVTICTMVVFRATSLATVGILYRRMLVPSGGQRTPLPAASLILAVVVMALAHWLAHQRWVGRLRWRAPEFALGFGYGGLLLVSLLLAPKSGQAFVYFQF